MDGNNPINQKKIFLVAWGIFAMVMLFAFMHTILSKKTVEFYNIDQIPSDFSPKIVEDLEDYIYSELKEVHGSATPAGTLVLIRPNSFIKTELADSTNKYEFLIDIDSLSTTYKVSFALDSSGFTDRPTITCPQPDEMKYPGQNCQSAQTSTMTVTIGRYLPYQFTTDDGHLVIVTRKTDDDGQEYLNVRASWCGDEQIKQEIKTEIEAWIKGLALGSEVKYNIIIPEFCDGAAR